MSQIWDKKPDFINEKGVKWWRDASTTRYARREDAHGTTLEAVVWLVEEPNGHRTRLLIADDGEFLGENQNLEALGAKIDILKMAKRSAV